VCTHSCAPLWLFLWHRKLLSHSHTGSSSSCLLLLLLLFPSRAQLGNTEEYIDGALAGNLGEVLIRCNNVLYVRAAEDVSWQTLPVLATQTQRAHAHTHTRTHTIASSNSPRTTLRAHRISLSDLWSCTATDCRQGCAVFDSPYGSNMPQRVPTCHRHHTHLRCLVMCPPQSSDMAE
jgi:hypothetical protein